MKWTKEKQHLKKKMSPLDHIGVKPMLAMGVCPNKERT